MQISRFFHYVLILPHYDMNHSGSVIKNKSKKNPERLQINLCIVYLPTGYSIFNYLFS